MDVPSSGERGTATSARSSGGAKSVRALRILLVEDDVLVRCGTADMLSYAGHHVVEAGSAPEALEIFARGEIIDLLITDNRMPSMSGAALIARVREGWPTLPILLVTGYASREEGIGPDVGLLTKPFREARLLTAVSEIVERSPAQERRRSV